MRRFLFVLLILMLNSYLIQSQTKENREDKPICKIDRFAKLEIRLGASDRFIKNHEFIEISTLKGFNPSAHLTLPLRILKQPLFLKLLVGHNTNNVNFNLLEDGAISDLLDRNRTSLYQNIYYGVGIGKSFNLNISTRSFLRFPLNINFIHLPKIVSFSSEEFIPISSRDYSSQIRNNESDEFNFNIVPEIGLEYHFILSDCKSFNIGFYYSRGLNQAYTGSISIERANGEVVSQTFSKPFNSYGISIGYGIYRSKN